MHCGPGNIGKISEYWFNIAQVIFLIWNAINDPLFGYLQDTCESEIFRKRRKAVLYGAPLFAMSFLLPWFPWIQGVNGHWVTGVHLIVSLCFYDALFTYARQLPGFPSSVCSCSSYSSKTCDVTAFVLFKQLVTQPNLNTPEYTCRIFLRPASGPNRQVSDRGPRKPGIGHEQFEVLLSFFFSRIVVLMSGSLLSKYGSYHVIEWSFYIK
ncbi:predicted protein, partial [Nematostella vectensis]